MQLPPQLTAQGFALDDVTQADSQDYIDVKRACYRKYVDEYYGGWVEEVQIGMNTNVFNRMLGKTCFKKLLLNNETAGFFSYDEQEDQIGGITIQMLEAARNRGVGSFYLRHVTGISDRTGKPVYLKVFKSNPAQNLYRRFGFVIYEENESHYWMRYTP
jgi:ribosomal protein S18 acetylase RimI-like enzyme